jgi:outer membrane protein OmpA-like peptidoglycan-associated protein/uncharacterized protein YidB (DUF937 family)
MALFDSIINGVSEKFGLGDKAGTLLSALLALMTNQETGGFSGFLDRFKDAGLGDMATSWITSSDNAEVSDEQIEAAIGSETIDTIAEQVGIERDKTTSALAFMTPQVIDSLTPDGEVPDDESLLSKISGFLTGLGGAAIGAAGAMASGAADKAEDAVDAAKDAAGVAADKVGDAAEAVGDTAEAAVDKGKEVAGAAAEAVGDAAEAVGDKVSDTFNAVGDVFDGDGDGDGSSILTWLLPLLLLGILLVLGFMFCSGNNATKPADTNTNTTETKDGKTDEATGTKDGKTDKADVSSVSLEAKDGKYFLTGTVKDEETKNQILKEAEATFGAGNVDASGLKVDANVAALKDGWFDGFKSLLPDLKGWKTGTISWAGDKLTTAGEIPGAVADKIKSLFSGWSLAGAADAVSDAAKKLTEVTLSEDTKLEAYPDGIEDQLIKFIKSDEYKNATDEDLKNKWFDFDDLNFKFGTTELEAKSQRQLDNIVAILKEYPEVKIKIGGYTDKKGDDARNKTLSDNRAKAVKAALEKAGVGTQVTEAEGYGEEFAKVAETASDEERAVDRKTSIRLIK